jgi:hypothetical protein
MTWVMHVAAERQGTVQACMECGHVLQDVTPPPGLIIPPAEVEAIASEVPWWPAGGRVAVRGNASVDLASLLPGADLAWEACTTAAAP